MARIIQIKGVKESVPLRCSEDVYSTLEEKVQDLVADAVQRAKDNDRKTLMGHDF